MQSFYPYEKITSKKQILLLQSTF